MKQATNVAKTAAHQTYTEKRAEAVRLLDVLSEALQYFDSREAADKRNWGFAGTMGDVTSKLTQMASSLLDVREEDVTELANLLA